MTGKSETVSEFPASFVVAMSKAIKRQMILDGVIRVEEMHFVGPVPGEGDYPHRARRNMGSRMEYMRKHGVFEVVDENPLTLKWVDKVKGDVCCSRLVRREIKQAKRTACTRKRIFTHAAVGRVEDARVHDDDRT